MEKVFEIYAEIGERYYWEINVIFKDVCINIYSKYFLKLYITKQMVAVV